MEKLPSIQIDNGSSSWLEAQAHLLAHIHSAEASLKQLQLRHCCLVDPALWPHSRKANTKETFWTGLITLSRRTSGQDTVVKLADWLLYKLKHTWASTGLNVHAVWLFKSEKNDLFEWVAGGWVYVDSDELTTIYYTFLKHAVII